MNPFISTKLTNFGVIQCRSVSGHFRNQRRHELGVVEASDCICNTICMHHVRLAKGVEQDLKRIPVFHRNRILDAIETQLATTPDAPTKNRKLLENLITPWEAVPPIWELRVGEYRVFYDVSEEEAVVYIRAIRRKPRGKRTEDIL
jgi:mRNA-degrading endonuclease RelE of RelBE toxin-antitoxin system